MGIELMYATLECGLFVWKNPRDFKQSLNGIMITNEKAGTHTVWFFGVASRNFVLEYIKYLVCTGTWGSCCNF